MRRPDPLAHRPPSPQLRGSGSRLRGSGETPKKERAPSVVTQFECNRRSRGGARYGWRYGSYRSLSGQIIDHSIKSIPEVNDAGNRHNKPARYDPRQRRRISNVTTSIRSKGHVYIAVGEYRANAGVRKQIFHSNVIDQGDWSGCCLHHGHIPRSGRTRRLSYCH